MNKYLSILIVVLFTFFSSTAYAFDPPPPVGYVVDMAGKLTQDQISDLNRQADDLNKRTNNELAALIIPSLNGESIEDVAYTTFKSWKVGKANLDNGALLVIAVAERKSRIETGKGIGGEITDVQASRILQNDLAPNLRKGDFSKGISQSFTSMAMALDSRVASPAPKLHQGSSESSFWAVVIFAVTAVCGIIGGIWSHLSGKKKEEEARIKHLERLEEINRAAAKRKAEKDAADLAESVRQLALKSKKDMDEKVKYIQSKFPPNPPVKNTYTPTPIEPVGYYRKPEQIPYRKPEPSYHPPVSKLPTYSRTTTVTPNNDYYERQRRQQQEESDRRAAQQRADDENRRKTTYSSYSSDSSSSSSYSPFGGGSDYGGGSSGGGFGGGDSGGGGASGDW